MGPGAARKIPFPYRCWPFQVSKVSLLPLKERSGEEVQATPASWPLLTPPTAHMSFGRLWGGEWALASESWHQQCVKRSNHSRGSRVSGYHSNSSRKSSLTSPEQTDFSFLETHTVWTTRTINVPLVRNTVCLAPNTSSVID